MEEMKNLELGKMYDIQFERKEGEETKTQEVEYMEFHVIQKMKDCELYVFKSAFADVQNQIIAYEDGTFIDGSGRVLGFKESEPRIVKNVRIAESVLREKAVMAFNEQAEQVIEFIRGL